MKSAEWPHQVLGSVNLAVIAVVLLEEKGHSAFLGKLAYPFDWVHRFERGETYSNGYLRFFSMCLPLAAIIFLVVRFVYHSSLPRAFSVAGIGVAGAVAYPFGVWGHLHRFFRISHSESLLLFIEVALASILVILSLDRTWLLSATGAALLTTHFTLWAAVSRSLGAALDVARATSWRSLSFWIIILHALFLPALGFLCCLTWGIFVRRMNQTRLNLKLADLS